MRRFELKKGTFTFETGIEFFFEKRVTRFGNGAKIDAPKKCIGKRAIVLICKE